MKAGLGMVTEQSERLQAERSGDVGAGAGAAPW